MDPTVILSQVPIDAETLKLVGGGSAQLILAAGYLPTFWLIRVLWKGREEVQAKYEQSLQNQISNSKERAVVDQAGNQLMAELIKRLSVQS